jgi:hypothetical protein
MVEIEGKSRLFGPELGRNLKSVVGRELTDHLFGLSINNPDERATALAIEDEGQFVVFSKQLALVDCFNGTYQISPFSDLLLLQICNRSRRSENRMVNLFRFHVDSPPRLSWVYRSYRYPTLNL